ncbi:MAG: TadE/TadG family type IV pilus assembly protein, partial [Thermaurantiacus sp.]
MSCASGLLADRRGSTAILTAFSLALVLGFVALGIEAARGLQVQRALQAAADSGTRAGVLAIRAGAPDPVTESLRIAQAAAPAADAEVDVRWPPATGAHVGDLSAMEMRLSRKRTPILGRFIGDPGGQVAARAVARLKAGPEACLLALQPVPGSIRVPRPADLRLNSCGMLHAGGGVPQLRLAEADPYRGRLLPQPTGCTATALVVTGQLAIAPGQSAVFCNGLTIAAGGVVQLGPGLHVVDGGILTVMPGGTLVADRATILLRGTGGRMQASINVQNGARV